MCADFDSLVIFWGGTSMTGPHGDSIFSFLGKLHTGSHSARLRLLPYQQSVGVLVSELSPAFLVICFLVDNHSDWGWSETQGSLAYHSIWIMSGISHSFALCLLVLGISWIFRAYSASVHHRYTAKPSALPICLTNYCFAEVFRKIRV